MNEITPLLEEYNSLVNVIMHTDYSVQEYQATEQKIATTLKQLNGRLSQEHLSNITKVSQVLNSEAIMVPMAEAVSSIKCHESFDYVLNQFLDCFENGRNETVTATACYEAMQKIDADRVQRYGIDKHPFLM